MEKIIEALRAYSQAQDERYNQLVQRLEALEARLDEQQQAWSKSQTLHADSLRQLSDELQALRRALTDAPVQSVPESTSEEAEVAPETPTQEPDDEVEIEFLYEKEELEELPEPLAAPEEQAAEPQPEIPAEPTPEPEPARENHPQPFSAQVGTPVDDIRKAISLGDRFLFVRELFANNGEELQKTIDALNQLHSLDEALDWIDRHFNWDKESKAYELFVNVLRRRY